MKTINKARCTIDRDISFPEIYPNLAKFKLDVSEKQTWKPVFTGDNSGYVNTFKSPSKLPMKILFLEMQNSKIILTSNKMNREINIIYLIIYTFTPTKSNRALSWQCLTFTRNCRFFITFIALLWWTSLAAFPRFIQCFNNTKLAVVD